MTWAGSAQTSGARLEKVAECLSISERALERWRAAPLAEDGRKGAVKACPHAFTEEEKFVFISKVNTPEYRDLAPAVAVAKLADEGEYLGSESTLYR